MLMCGKALERLEKQPIDHSHWCHLCTCTSTCGPCHSTEGQSYRPDHGIGEQRGYQQHGVVVVESQRAAVAPAAAAADLSLPHLTLCLCLLVMTPAHSAHHTHAFGATSPQVDTPLPPATTLPPPTDPQNTTHTNQQAGKDDAPQRTSSSSSSRSSASVPQQQQQQQVRQQQPVQAQQQPRPAPLQTADGGVAAGAQHR